MANLIADLTHPMKCFRDTAEQTADKLRTSAHLDATGVVLRWNSNRRCVPTDCAELAAHLGIGVNLEAHEMARKAEDSALIAAYVAGRERRGYSDEERFEMRAAFGPGVEVVNVFTGRTTRT